MSIKNILPITAEPPLPMAEWLHYPYSLTDRLIEKAGNVSLVVLGHDWALPTWWDKQVLDITALRVMRREIMMYAHAEACWYARTIIPSSTIEADAAFFNRLQQESLGALIFNEPKIKRENIHIYPINEQCIEYHWVHASLSPLPAVLWARWCEYRLNETFPFFLIEIMLPVLQRYSD